MAMERGRPAPPPKRRSNRPDRDSCAGRTRRGDQVAAAPSNYTSADAPAILTPDDYTRARRLLMRRDPVLGTAIKQIGPCLLAERQRKDHLTALVGSIVSQQLSTKAAATIFGRFVALFPEGNAAFRPRRIAALDDQTLRGVGFSGRR